MAFDLLMRELDDQVYPDGFQAELTTGYQGVLTWDYGSIIRLYKSLSLPVPSALAHRYGRLWEIYPRLMMPDGRTPDLNDGERCNVAKRMREALTYEPARADWQWFATGGKEGTLAGQAGCQSGWPQPVESQRQAGAKAVAAAVMPYFDATCFAARITCPVRFAVGFADVTCPPHCTYAAFNALASEDKDLVYGIGMGHTCWPRYSKALSEWLRK